MTAVIKRVRNHCTILILCLLVGCGMDAAQTQTPLATPIPEPTSSPAPTVTETLVPTATQTSTPVPSETATSTPTATYTPQPAPTETVPPPTATPAPPETTAGSTDVVARGIHVYKSQYCGVCHELDAAGTAGIFGPSHNQIGSLAEQRIQNPRYAGTARTPSEYIRESILDPNAHIVEGYGGSRHPMPAFTHLSDADVDALVQMLLQQR